MSPSTQRSNSGQQSSCAMDDSTDCYINSLLSVWPVMRCLASHSGVGDLISISRTNSTFRAALHGFGLDKHLLEQDAQNVSAGESVVRRAIRIGKHQTRHWANLKGLAFYTCSSPTHTKGDNIHPCKYCSLPICEACIVRSSFANPHENTFKNRVRLLCPTCWRTGNLRKDHRFPADHVSREHIWRGRNYSQRGSFCTCTAKADAWLCIPCKDSQNNLASCNGVPLRDQIKTKGKSKQQTSVECYGIACRNWILEDDRDRRRICLWCSKPLPRQYGGEDRFRWDNKLIEARAINAASRSADIEEWARNRFKALTMSRREMRGTVHCLVWSGVNDAENDKPQFVRHLDAVNYRTYLPEDAVPEPEAVWRSKNGQWRYKRAFLESIGQRLQVPESNCVGIDATALRFLTAQNGLLFARTNFEIRKEKVLEFSHTGEGTSRTRRNKVYLPEQLRAHILQYHIAEDWNTDQLIKLLKDQFDIGISKKQLEQTIHEWQSKKTRSKLISVEVLSSSQRTAFDKFEPLQSDLENATCANTGESSRSASLPEERELAESHLGNANVNADANSHLVDLQDTESAILEHVLQASISSEAVTLGGLHEDDPPPYSP